MQQPLSLFTRNLSFYSQISYQNIKGRILLFAPSPSLANTILATPTRILAKLYSQSIGHSSAIQALSCLLPQSSFPRGGDMDTRLLVSADATLAAARSRSRPSTSAFQRQIVVPGCRSSSSCRSVRARSAAAAAPAAGGISGHSNGVYTVGDFMTGRDKLHVVQPTTPVDQALELLVQHKISGLPVVDDDGKLVGVVSDYDLLALDSISGHELADTNTNMFPDVDSTWKTFHEIQRLLSKTNGKVIGDVMTSSPLAVRQNTNLDAAARLLLETKYRRLPVVDSMGKLVGMITRGNIVSAALKIKKKTEGGA